MAATTTSATPESELSPELLERLKKLSPESRDRLIVLLGGSPPIPDPPPVGDWEYWKTEIERRVEAVRNGTDKALTPEEMYANIRAALEESRK